MKNRLKMVRRESEWRRKIGRTSIVQMSVAVRPFLIPEVRDQGHLIRSNISQRFALWVLRTKQLLFPKLSSDWSQKRSSFESSWRESSWWTTWERSCQSLHQISIRFSKMKNERLLSAPNCVTKSTLIRCHLEILRCRRDVLCTPVTLIRRLM
jgi:hypothetical protein